MQTVVIQEGVGKEYVYLVYVVFPDDYDHQESLLSIFKTEEKAIKFADEEGRRRESEYPDYHGKVEMQVVIHPIES